MKFDGRETSAGILRRHGGVASGKPGRDAGDASIRRAERR